MNHVNLDSLYGFSAETIIGKADTSFQMDTTLDFKGVDVKNEENSVTQKMSFTFEDSSPNDLFDVKITRDPIYGTPIFQTLGGRSECPHEEGTDNSDNFNLKFKIAKKMDSVQFPEFDGGENNGVIVLDYSANKKCAHVNVVYKNGLPGGNREHTHKLIIDRGAADSTLGGVTTKINGQTGSSFNVVPILAGVDPHGDPVEREQTYQISFCPVDEQVVFNFASYNPADEKFVAVYPNDTTKGIPGVFKNISIEVVSSCEYSLLPCKIWLKQEASSDVSCSGDGYSNIFNHCIEPLSEYDVNFEKLQGEDIVSEKQSVHFVHEPYLRSRVRIDCLSFVGKCGCNPESSGCQKELDERINRNDKSSLLSTSSNISRLENAIHSLENQILRVEKNEELLYKAVTATGENQTD